MNRRLPFALGLVPACLAGLMLSCSVDAASGGGDTGWYAGGELGLDISTTQNFNQGGIGVQNKDNTGVLAGFNGGWEFSNGVRLELSYDYHSDSVGGINAQNVNGVASPSNDVQGHVTASTALANVLYDFKQPDGFFAVIYPYVGVGIGVADVDVENEHFTTFQETQGSANGSKIALAYQLNLGGAWDLDPNWSAVAGFRYLITSNVSIKPGAGCVDSSEGGTVTNVCGIAGIYRSPEIYAGLKYKFGASEE